ncbi:MAG: MIP/aquaporin family protein [Mycobacteriales bacterium]
MSRTARPQPARGGWHWQEWVAEWAGTALLLLGGFSAICLDFGAHSPIAAVVASSSWRLLITGLLFAGSGSLVAVSPLGRLSGAHLNPAVTISFWVQRHVHPHDRAGYILGQFAGGLTGTALAWLLWGRTFTSAPVRWARTAPASGLGVPAAIGVEALMTAVLVITIFVFVSSPKTARWTPLAVWIVIAVLVWRGAPYTGTSLNPARSLGPDLFSGSWPAWEVYLVGPLAGAAAACALWALAARRQTLTAKLFHDPRYRSVLRSELPALAA